LIYNTMTLRLLTDIERHRFQRLAAESMEVTLIQPTRTGLGKSILDATAPVRNYLRDNKIHDFDAQRQGTDHRIQLQAALLEESIARPSRASLYRPVSKKGDPRIWFSGLPAYAKPNDMIAIVAHEGRLAAINLTRIDIDRVLDETKRGALWELVQEIRREATSVSEELLRHLRTIAARGLVPSVMETSADTAIGRTLEAALGIPMNARRAPDYKGIELKSYRRATSAARENRKTLFAKVPNWEISKFKSSAQILNAFGYTRDADFKLYCTTSTQKPNSQGLIFKFNTAGDQLDEHSTKKEIGAFASWHMDDLKKTLLEKHNETFWIGATSQTIRGREHFSFIDARHTRKPITAQFDILLEQGEITMDHLIKRNANGGVTEKGPLFKITSSALGLLFPPSQTYSLMPRSMPSGIGSI
jgi:hypothetical protein